MNIGIYIHIPFCRKKCDYCNFYSIAVNNNELPDIVEKYTGRLVKEINARSEELSGHIIETIYFGGGTPSVLSPDHIYDILSVLQSISYFKPEETEISIECNPEDYSRERVESYRKTGVNRINLGIQTMDSRLHKNLGRSSPLIDKFQLLEFCSISGIVHGIDLILGIPDQDEIMLERELENLCKAGPEHISAYLLSVDKGTSLHDRIRVDNTFHEMQRRTFEKAIEFLKGNGYAHYEVSNFCKPGYFSAHNLKYWKFQPYLGFGAGAHSFNGNQRYFNDQTVVEYLNSDYPARVIDERDSGAATTEYLFSAIRLLEGFTINELLEKTGCHLNEGFLQKLKILGDRKLIILEEIPGDQKIKISPEGFFIMDSVILELIQYL